mmetsp:Transcript_129592/g.242471  ORF Transcript_129592/g.242471 Transcript_129592/m.242471 type:complete len:248 (-) Transcript_129592:79-822(-)
MGNFQSLAKCKVCYASERQSPLRILCYGDSNTAGFRPPRNVPPMVPWGVSLQRILREEGFDVEVEVNGNSGKTAEELFERRFESKIADITGTINPGLQYRLDSMPNPPELVIIMLGTNDFSYERTSAEVEKDVEALHEVCHESGIKTVALAAIHVPTNEENAVLNNLRHNLSGLARAMSVYDKSDDDVIGHMDPRGIVSRDAHLGLWEKDNMHWSEKGHVAFAEAVAPVIEDALTTLGHFPATDPIQ